LARVPAEATHGFDRPSVCDPPATGPPAAVYHQLY
jgi:hypothetical protein